MPPGPPCGGGGPPALRACWLNLWGVGLPFRVHRPFHHVLREVHVHHGLHAEENAESPSYDVNTQGGPDHQTPLHFASASNHQNAPSLLNALLINGHANPSVIDSRGRPPYFVASSDKARDAFRLARGTLGEKYCRWDDEAKVGPALTDEDVQAKKAKAWKRNESNVPVKRRRRRSLEKRHKPKRRLQSR